MSRAGDGLRDGDAQMLDTHRVAETMSSCVTDTLASIIRTLEPF